ncbi:PIN domain-containing protein [Amycolatopsis sp. cg9]|uniref:PIN domain-containing protein n=1 Tax=Amycolatopsis sp. cg9 TaxID=3238801 RepID=UPI0035231A07
MTSSPAPEPYARRLLTELTDIHAAFAEILSASEIINVDPNRPGSGVLFIGHPTWGWAPSPDVLEADRMSLLRRVRDWEPRFRLLFPHPTPIVRERLDSNFQLLESWLVRTSGAHDVPPTLNEAVRQLAKTVDGLGGLTNLLPADEYTTRLTVDTNTLIDNPDLAVHVSTLGAKYMVHLLPVVLREIDDLKRGGRTQDLREAAKRAERRLKGLRNNGNVQSGVRVAGEVWAVFEHIEPKNDRLPSWLDLSVPDDRFVASTLLLQSDHPGSAVYVATGDINLQTKLAAVGLPYVELP